MLEQISNNQLQWVQPQARRVDSNMHIETAYFKHILHIPHASSAKARILISAASRYCLYVNGEAIADGPCKGAEWYHFCEELDIAPYLRDGDNVLAVKVTAFPSLLNRRGSQDNWGPCSVMTESCGPLLLADGCVDMANGQSISFSTLDTDWFCQTDDAITWQIFPEASLAGATETVRGDKLPHGWTTNTAVEDSFTKAIPYRKNECSYGEFTRLLLHKRPIPLLIREPLAPLTALAGTGNLHFDADGKAVCAPNQTYSIVLEAPQLTTSYVSLPCTGGKDSRVTLTYSEGYVKRDEKNRTYKAHRKDSTGIFEGMYDIYCPSGQTEVYSPFWFRTFLLMRIEVTTGAEPLTLHLPQLTETRYPLENKATIASAQNWVKPIWDISLRTLQLCMHETYEDCPYYEQLQYIMDTRLQMLFTYAVSNDTRMAKRTIHDFHSSLLPEGICQSRFPSIYSQVIPAFSLHWVLMIHDYVEETGDLEFVRPYRASVERVFEWFGRHKNALGLVENLGYWDYADWADEWPSGIPNAVAKGGAGTINNLSYAYTMQTIAPLFTKLGLPALSARYINEAEQIKSAVMQHCWNNERQLLREGPDFEEYSQHAQIWGVLCGLFTEDTAKSVMRTVLTDKTLVKCSFVMQFYMFRALEAAGAYAETETLWNMWRSLLDEGLTTVPEIPGAYTRSDCHAWGALMLYEFPRKALGITPLDPGYTRIQIKPIAIYLQTASGSVPTPHGAVTVAWTSDEAAFNLRIETPVPAQVILPNGCISNVDKGVHTFTTQA